MRRGAAALALCISMIAGATTREARAQACCGGGSAATPSWIGEMDRAMAGLQVRAGHTIGAYEARGRFFSAPPGDELRIDATAFATARVFARTQLSAALPVVLTHRTRPAGSETGAGVGDVSVSARYDVLRAGQHPVIPGVGLVATLAAPTGRPPDAAQTLLASDVSGIGAWELGGALLLERAFGDHVAALASAAAYWRAPRTVLGVPQQLGPRGLALVGAGWIFDGQAAAWLTLAHLVELDTVVDGARAAGTGRRATQLSAIGLLPLSDAVSLRGVLSTDLPAGLLGENQIATAGVTVGALYKFR